MSETEPAQRALLRLLEVMRRLRDPNGGCPWDREQDFASIAPYTIEEAYEVADAIGRDSPGEIEAELGDLLFQVVFHARMGEERGWFDFASVADSISDKLTARHPHVFADAKVASVSEQSRVWEEHKARERADRPGQGASELADVPLALPALARAAKLGKRAGRVGFDWPDASGVREKIEEELREVAQASAQQQPEEIGDLLFAVANWSRHLGVDPEESLRLANAKFERRFRGMEALARERSLSLAKLDAAAWDALWNEVKGREKSGEFNVQ
jgi:nucleoside triphosphate diphosphatase